MVHCEIGGTQGPLGFVSALGAMHLMHCLVLVAPSYLRSHNARYIMLKSLSVTIWHHRPRLTLVQIMALSPVWCQAIIWTNDDTLSTGLLGEKKSVDFEWRDSWKQMGAYSALWLLIPWCWSTRPSITTVLTTYSLHWTHLTHLFFILNNMKNKTKPKTPFHSAPSYSVYCEYLLEKWPYSRPC